MRQKKQVGITTVSVALFAILSSTTVNADFTSNYNSIVNQANSLLSPDLLKWFNGGSITPGT